MRLSKSISAYSHLFGVFAAIIVLASWLISNTLVARVEADTRSVDAVRNEQTQFRQFSDLSNEQRTVIKKLWEVVTRQRDLYAELVRHSDSGESNLNSAIEELSWIEALQSDISALDRSAQRLSEWTVRTNLPENSRRSINVTVAEAKQLCSSFAQERGQFKQAQDKLLSSFTDSDGVNFSEAESDKYTTLINGHSERIDKLMEKYEATNDAIHSRYEDLYGLLSEKRNRSARLQTFPRGWLLPFTS